MSWFRLKHLPRVVGWAIVGCSAIVTAACYASHRLDRAELRTVARDLALADGWMNAVVGAQWLHGFPPGLTEDVVWRNYGEGLDVGLVGRRTLIVLKLFAAVDGDPGSVHAQDLVALRPTEEELESAAVWVRTQDAAAEWPSLVEEVVRHVERSCP